MDRTKSEDTHIPEHIRGFFGSDSNEDFGIFGVTDSKNPNFPPGLFLSDQLYESNYQKDRQPLSLPQYGRTSANGMQNTGFPEILRSSPNPLQMNTSNYVGLSGLLNDSSNTFYNVPVNEDVFLIERIDSILTQISTEYNPYCPTCLKSYYSKSSKKYYLTHFDCYYKFKKDLNQSIKPLNEISSAKISLQDKSIDISQLIPNNRKFNFITVEAYHPISSYLHFKAEKSATGFEETHQGKQVFHFNFENKVTSINEPNVQALLYPELRMEIAIASCPSNDDPYNFEFLIDARSINLSLSDPEKNIEFIHQKNGNLLRLGFQAFLDVDNRFFSKLNFKVCIPERSNSQEPARILILRYVALEVSPSPKMRKFGVGDKIQEEDEESLSPQDRLIKPQLVINRLSSHTHSSTRDEISSFTADTERNTDTQDIWMTMGNKHLTGRKEKKSQTSITPATTKWEFSKQTSLSLNLNHDFQIPNQRDIAPSPRFINKESTLFSLSNLDWDWETALGQLKSQSQSLSNIPNFEPSEMMNSNLPFNFGSYQGKFFKLSTSPLGSKMIQKHIPRATNSELDMVISELKLHLFDILVDPHANYMFQTLMQHSSPQQRYVLLSNLVPLIPQVACHKKGTHALQAIISIIKGNEEEQLFETGLTDHVVDLSKDLYGTHFIQKFITSLPPDRLNCVFRPIMADFKEMAKHSYGLCVLKCLIVKIETLEMKKEIITCVAEHLNELIQDAFGNYAVQHILEMFKSACGPIFEAILPNIVEYSNQKFSSNVVEKAIETASQEFKIKLTDGILKNERLIDLMTNKYGNFVINKAYNLSEESHKKLYLSALYKSYVKIHSSKYKTRWTTFFEGCSNAPNTFNKGIIANKNNLPTDSRIKGFDSGFEPQEGNPSQSFSERKKGKGVTYVVADTSKDNYFGERSKNRKYSAPISGIKSSGFKFTRSTNFY